MGSRAVQPHAVQLSPGVYYVSPSPSPANTGWRRDRRARLAGEFEGFAPPPFGRPFDPAFRYVRVGVHGIASIEGETPGLPAGTRRTWIAFSFPANGAFPEAFLAAAGPGVRSRDVPSSFLLPTLPNGRNGTNGGDRVSFVTAIDLRRFIASHEASRVFTRSTVRHCAALCGAMCCLSPVTTNDYGIGYPPVWPTAGWAGLSQTRRRLWSFGVARAATRGQRAERGDRRRRGVHGAADPRRRGRRVEGEDAVEGDAVEGDAVDDEHSRENLFHIRPVWTSCPVRALDALNFPHTSAARKGGCPEDIMSVTLHTNLGDLKVELFCEDAPRTCENFLALCASEYYDNTSFHRNIKGFMIQGGDPTGTGRGGQSIWGGKFPDEIRDNLKHTNRGVMSMANSGPNTNASQFFFTYAKCPHPTARTRCLARSSTGSRCWT